MTPATSTATKAATVTATKTTDMLQLKDRIRLARRSTGMTQEQLAKRVGVSRISVVLWESGRVTPVLKHLRGVAESTGVPMGVLDGSVVQLSPPPAPEVRRESAEIDAQRQQIWMMQDERRILLAELRLAKAKSKWQRIFDGLVGAGITAASFVTLFLATGK